MVVVYGSTETSWSLVEVEDKTVEALLKSRGSYVSCRQIATQLGVPVSVIKRAVRELRRLSYPIKSGRGRGYTIMEFDTLSPDKIKQGLKTKFIGRIIHHFIHVGSTQEIAKELATQGAVEGTVIIAETQSVGRGRLGRGWFSPVGGIWMSLLLSPKRSVKKLQVLNLLAALAVSRSIEKACGIEARIKWPNDVLIQGRKVAGILSETFARGGIVNSIVLGMGINANVDTGLFPFDLRSSATSLSATLGNFVDRVALVQFLLKELETLYEEFEREGSGFIINELKRVSTTLGRKVKVISFDEVTEGLAVDIHTDGALVVRVEDGATKLFYIGDVSIIES